MLSRVRLTQKLAAGVQTQRAFSTSAKWSQRKDQRETALEQKTLDLLLETALKDKGRPLQEPAQRYHKFHKVGDLYHPRDLNDAEYQEMLRRRRNKPDPPKEDPFDKFDINPLHQYKDTKLLSCFVSDMGKILPRSVTGVSAKNQRKLAQAIKRARAMGLMSSTSQRNCSK